MFYLPRLVDAHELKETFDHEVKCIKCGVPLEAAYFDFGDYYCETCVDALAAELNAEAVQFAQEHCKLTKPLPKYDPSCEFRCTPEEYECGQRESYTPNSY